MNSLNFRPEVEGLRGIAVLLVTMFHLEAMGFSGGFLGVDIFFVISGYLITRIIQRDIDDGRFSFLDFYARRFLRIAPALLVMLLATLCLSFFLVLPSDFRTQGAYAASSAAFISNFYYAAKISYFTTPAEANPFLHTWSLSVEEQFYLVMPLVLFLRPKWIAKNCVHLSILAASLALWIWSRGDGAAFFASQYRFWEFSAGAVAAGLTLPDGRFRRMLSTVSLGTLCVAIFVAPLGLDMKAAVTVIAVVSTGILLSTMQGTAPASAISLAPLRFFGRISYSMYLWHWPIIGLLAYVNIVPLSFAQVVFAFVASVVLGYLSWRFIETPFRYIKYPSFRVVVLATQSCALVAAVGLMIGITALAPTVTPEVTKLMAASNAKGKFRHCLDADIGSCRLGSPADGSLVVWGDSHAAALASKIDTDAKGHLGGHLFVTHSCSPILDVPGWWAATSERCATQNASVEKKLQNPAVKVVILHALWEKGVDGVAKNDGVQESDRVEAFTKRFAETLRRVSRPGLTVAVVGSIPVSAYDTFVPRALAVSAQTGVHADIEVTRQQFDATHPSDKALREVSAKYGAIFVDAAGYFCADKCHVSKDGVVYFFDNTHVTPAGAMVLDGFKQIFNRY